MRYFLRLIVGLIGDLVKPVTRRNQPTTWRSTSICRWNRSIRLTRTRFRPWGSDARLPQQVQFLWILRAFVGMLEFNHSRRDLINDARCINPKDLPTPQTYTQVVVATGSKMVFVSGQEPEDIHGKLVGPGDLATQARQVFGNLGRALAAAGARPAQVTRITIYVVNYKRDGCLPIIEKARIALYGDHKPADVVLGVATLSPDYLIEVDAIAIID